MLHQQFLLQLRMLEIRNQGLTSCWSFPDGIWSDLWNNRQVVEPTNLTAVRSIAEAKLTSSPLA